MTTINLLNPPSPALNDARFVGFYPNYLHGQSCTRDKLTPNGSATYKVLSDGRNIIAMVKILEKHRWTFNNKKKRKRKRNKSKNNQTRKKTKQSEAIDDNT